MNAPYKKQIFDDDPDLEEADRRIYNTASPLLKKYRNFLDIMENSGKEEEFFYTVGGNIMHYTGKTISKLKNRYIIKGRIVNLNLDSNKIDNENVGSKLKELNQLFDVVHLVNIAENTITPLLGKYKYMSHNAKQSSDLSVMMKDFGDTKVFSSERKKFRSYTDFPTLYKRLEESGTGYLSDVFGIRQQDGNYILQEIFLVPVSGTKGNEFLLCMKDYNKTQLNPYILDMNGNARDEYAKLWDNLIWNSDLKFYWKDRNFAYRGVSQAFLDFFGYDTPEEVLGKTDRDLELVVDIDAYEEGEKNIVNSGGKMINVPVECYVGGKPVMTMLSEIPVYDDGKLVGTVGFFSTEGDVFG